MTPMHIMYIALLVHNVLLCYCSLPTKGAFTHHKAVAREQLQTQELVKSEKVSFKSVHVDLAVRGTCTHDVARVGPQLTLHVL